MTCHCLLPSAVSGDLASSFDFTLQYLADRFHAASIMLATSAGVEQLGCLRDLAAIAAAMTQIPCGRIAGRQAKHKVAAWSFTDPSGQRLTLTPEVTAALAE